MKWNNWKKRLVCVCLLLSMTICSVCACAPASQENTELWIVTEQSTWDRMNGQLYVLEKAFEEAHSDVSIRVDYIPIDEQERSVYLQQLRTEILQGGGPDGYLLPTDNTLILDEPAQYTYVEVEPLFTDVDLAMRNGLFYDITELYDADDTLGKEGLNTRIMDAGVVDGTRYVLPLRYDMPVIYAQNHVLEAAGVDPAILTQDIGSIMEAVFAAGNPILAGGILYDGFSAFSSFIDYESGNAMLDEASLSQYMLNYQKLKSLLGHQYLDSNRINNEDQLALLATEDTILLDDLDIKKYIYCEYGEPEPEVEIPDNVLFIGGLPIKEDKPEYRTEYYPLWIGSMQDVFDYVPVSKHEETDLTITPMRTVDGDVVATVSYYAAVGSGCKNPELMYDFLRQFLLEESQWELNRPERNHTKPIKGTATNTSNDLQHPGLIGNGWPVRDKNSVQNLWDVRRKQIYIRGMGFFATDTQKLRMRQIGLMSELEEDRIPLFDVTIDQVRFNTTLSEDFAELLTQLNDINRENTPTQADIRKLAQQLCWNLRWHVSEG